MNLFMIAVIKQNKQIIGYRLLDVDEKPAKNMDVPVANALQVLKSGAATVNNIEVQGDSIVGTNGSIERYTEINTSGAVISKDCPLVVINQIGEVGYTVADYLGRVKKARNIDVVSYAKKHGIANGKLVMRDNIEFISSIAGEYKIEKVAPSKVKNTGNDVNVRIALNNVTEKGKVANNAGVDVSVEIENSNVFQSMSSNQQMVVKAYYVWYTVDKYRSLAKNIRFDISTNKAEALAELRGIEDWEFGGVWDSGYMGASKCQLGHAIRYEYYAVPSSDRDNPDAAIIFGENCAADFFHIKPEDMKSLVKTREIMSEEIKLMADILANNQEKIYMEKAELLYKICKKLGSREKIAEVFGKKVGDTLTAFIMVKVPFPMSLVLEAGKQSRKNIPNFFNKVFPEYRRALEVIFNANQKGISAVAGARKYLEFIGDNKIEGAYAYDPNDDTIKRRDVGGYNKKTRYERYSLLSAIKRRILATKFTYDELESVLNVIQKLLEIKESINNQVKFTESEDKINLAEQFAREAKSNREKCIRSNIYNAMSFDVETRYYNTLIYFKLDTGIESYHKDIQFLNTSVKKTMERLDKTVNDFKNFVESKRKEKADWEKREEERIERLREKERIQKEREEQERIAREKLEKEMAEQAERLKQERFKKDKVGILKSLIEANTEIAVDKGIEVAKAIVEKGVLYEDLSPKQRWRVDKTLEIFASQINNTDTKEEITELVQNNSYELDKHPEIKEKVEKLVDNKKKIQDGDKIALKIANTILRTNKATDKQLRYIDKALENMKIN